MGIETILKCECTIKYQATWGNLRKVAVKINIKTNEMM